jgi:hypothetical protein
LTWLFFSSLEIDIVWLATLAFVVFLIGYRRRKLAELAYFLSLQSQLIETTPGERVRWQARSWFSRRWLHRGVMRLRRGKKNRDA